jgi:hypothetical protein
VITSRGIRDLQPCAVRPSACEPPGTRSWDARRLQSVVTARTRPSPDERQGTSPPPLLPRHPACNEDVIRRTRGVPTTAIASLSKW